METEYPVARRLAGRESSKERQRRSQALGTKKKVQGQGKNSQTKPRE